MKWATDNVKAIMAFIVLAFSFAYFFVITFWKVKANDQVIIAIVAVMSNVVSYYFGASQGSNKKDELITQLTATPPAVTSSGDINITQSKNEGTN